MANISFNVFLIDPIQGEDGRSAKIVLEASNSNGKEYLSYIVDGLTTKYESCKEIVENFITNNVFGFNLTEKAKTSPMELIT